jgi:hypothetical protein
MKKYSVAAAFVFSFLAFAFSVQGQIIADEQRPFDFNDKYYATNGVIPEMLIARKNGADGESVFDFSPDQRFGQVRITATHAAYSSDGNGIFWNYYSGVSKNGFTEDENGRRAVTTAFAFPLYMFPSTTAKDSDRQAALIHMDEAYFEKNPIGIAAVMLVEFTDQIETKAGRVVAETLAKRNGTSLDGTPIIRTFRELDGLWRDGYVSITQPALDEQYRTPFAAAKVIRFPDAGGITPDAFLKFVKNPDGKPLDAEQHFVLSFECLKSGKKC